MPVSDVEIQDLLRQWRQLMAASRPRWSAVDLTFGQLRALSLLAQRQPLRMSELADALDITLASGSALADRMARHGLIVRRSLAGDRRIVLVELASRGRHLIDRLERGSSDHFSKMIERMTPDERAALATTLRAFLRISGEAATGAKGADAKSLRDAKNALEAKKGALAC
jgi:DNA-binding MarR family transcriptional regulator